MVAVASSEFDFSRVPWAVFWQEQFQGQEMRGSGVERQVRCPFHDDRQASVSLNMESGLWTCYACGEGGNGYQFLVKRGTNPAEAMTYLKRLAGVRDDASRPKMQYLKLAEYAAAKRLPLDFLSGLGIVDSPKGIRIPYSNEKGEVIAWRVRHSLSGPTRFSWSKGSTVIPYGLWLLNRAKEAKRVILVEGESDAQTLWVHGFPALGLPGASTFKPAHAELLKGLHIVYVVREPDQGGQTFVTKVAAGLGAVEFAGELREVVLPVKDVSALHMADPEAFPAAFQAALDAAQAVDLGVAVERARRPALTTPPVDLVQPDGWTITDAGIWGLDRTRKDPEWRCICPVPVLLTGRLRNLDTGEEKVGLAFRRDGQWHHISAPRSTVFQARSLPALADRGLPVSSETAKLLVRYFDDLERSNLDVLPVKRTVRHFGWIGAPGRLFIPGAAGEVEADLDDGMGRIASGYSETGDFDQWLARAAKARRHPMVRFVLAAGFAAPLLALVDHRTSILHLWGPSRAGKTAAAWWAISPWGDPETLIATFNATRVGLERLAALYADLPLVVDERQVMGDKQGMVESLVYMLGLGKGKVRGARDGGVQATATWRTIIITTGEEPLSTDASAAGVKTRALEWYGEPFEGEENEAREGYAFLKRHHGHAGPRFIAALQGALGVDPEMVRRDFEQARTLLQGRSRDAQGSHVATVAVVALADFYASQWIFGADEAAAFQESVALAGMVLGQTETAAEVDQATRALEWVRSWVAQHRPKFVGDTSEEYGWFGQPEHGDGGYVYIYPSAFQRCMKEGGFSERRTLRDFVERGWVLSDFRHADGKRRFKVRRRKPNTSDYPEVIALKPDVFYSLEKSEQASEQGGEQTESLGGRVI